MVHHDRCQEKNARSYIIQTTCWLLVLFLAKARHRAHGIVILAFGTGLLGCLFACVPLDVLCSQQSVCLLHILTLAL